jgi:hypothetical protein
VPDEVAAFVARLRELQRRAVVDSGEHTDNVVAISDNNTKEATVATKARTRTVTRTTATRKTKKCTRCSKTRKVDQFYADKSQKDGLSSWCKACTRDYDKAYRERLKTAGVAKLGDAKTK